MKKNVAVIGVGIVGTGKHGQGIPAFVAALRALSAEYRITVYSFIPVDKNKVPETIRVRCVPSQSMSMRMRYVYLGLLFALDHLRRRFHLIHAQSPVPAGLMARYLQKFFAIRWLLSFHATEAALIPERSFGDLMNASLARHSRQIVNHADLIMTMSSFQAKDVEKNLGASKSIRVLPRGIEVPPLKPKDLASPLLIVHISQYQPVKDHETLLKTFAAINRQINATFTVIGDNYEDAFQHQCEIFAPGVSIHVHGALRRERVREEIEIAHVLLHTSIYEGLPMVAFEAMAYGTIACGTRVGSFLDFPSTCCITAAVGDHEALAREIVSLAGDPDKFQRIRTAAHRWVSEHDINWYLSELKNIYNGLAQR